MDTHFPFIFLKKEERFNIFVLSFFLFLGDAYLQPETHSAVFSSFFQLQMETHSLFPFFFSHLHTKHIPLCSVECHKNWTKTHSAVFFSRVSKVKNLKHIPLCSPLFPFTNGNTLAVSVFFLFLHLHTKHIPLCSFECHKIVRKHIPLCFFECPKTSSSEDKFFLSSWKISPSKI